ncbi:dipeptidyl aminopeptidase/acylaminoacyl peptidase [Ereboglobus sp. PH5-5]|uniref:S9 family peptidase n=1 Tax=Ereboglobus sp. PH5-5 TaxID=2940529 RepID=UPI002405C98F|nr:S9 family peptidase [Ereboglobus sp. PH5-5]MDF9832576.1 dipeptidyl aminopeptidase/acylaminoacyl peptidase [Ereboglobus sp. PH5-5]
MHPKRLLVFLTALFTATALCAEIPLDDFLKEPDFSEIRISPDGSKVAVTARWKEKLALSVIDLKTKERKILTAPPTMDVVNVRWVGNNRLIFTGVEEIIWGGKSANGGLFAIDADGKNPTVLNESATQKGKKGGGYRGVNFLSYYGDSTDEILVRSNQRRALEPDVYRMNVRTGIKRVVATNPGGVQYWVADHKGAVRAAFGQKGLERFFLYRDTANGKWREIKRWKVTEGGIHPLAFDQDNRMLYVSSNVGRDTASIRLFDPEKGVDVKELFASDTYDVEDVVLARDDHRLLGYAYDGARPTWVWEDKRLKALQSLLDQELPDTVNYFSSMSTDGAWTIVRAFSDRDPGTYYLFNTKELTMEKVFSPREWINPKQMSEVRPISYTARDGMTIHGYLTLPAGKEPRNLPLIVNPHGGPWARDSWGFNYEIQFLASRGYAVLQMNFRGSTGYGGKLLEAGYGQWGLAMQDDITDGVKWVIDQGYADPKRIAIYGASYGGFATMAGLTFTPELYCCGINYVGVTDIALLLKTIPKHWEPAREELELKAGDILKDRERLKATSPLEHADKVRVPVFFAYGELDERVDVKHATRFVSKLRSRGIPVELMLKNNEGHGFVLQENNRDYYTTLERFLAKYMK